MKRFLKILLPILLSIVIIAGIFWYFFSYDKGLTEDILCSWGRFFANRDNIKAASWFYNLAYDQNHNNDDVAIEAADIVIMNDEPSKLVKAIEISKKTHGIAMQNIVFALVVKIGILILIAFGLANMWAAVFADVGVCVLAILNAMRALK